LKLSNLYLISEYYPQNIMHDKRIARGSTYAAMVIPAGTNPDAMMMDKRNETKKSKSFKRTNQVRFEQL
jgi:Radial spoke protein 3